MAGRVIYLVRSWPRLSQTFILNEVLGLERRGVPLTIVSLVRSGEPLAHPQVGMVASAVTYLDERTRFVGWRRLGDHAAVAVAHPGRYLRTLLFCLAHPGLAAGYGDLTAVRCLHHAVKIARQELRTAAVDGSAVHVHAHFAHDPALVGLFLARLIDLPFSFTGHARDLVQIPADALARRAAAAAAVVTCCEANAHYIRSSVPAASLPPLRVIHHGVELNRFAPIPPRGAAGVPMLLSVGRLVEKKGFGDLLRALAALRADGVDFRCRIYGSGPLLDPLLVQRDELGLRDRVQLMGAVSSPEIVAALAAADVFVLAPRVTADGDRDGIPNVLVEAMASRLPVVATSAGGVPELVAHDVNGLLVPPEDVVGLAAALRRLIAEPATRARLASEARRTVEADYDVDAAAIAMEAVFRPAAVVVEERLS
jgi:glycosyltransferase involved in cell wall biosynthesis